MTDGAAVYAAATADEMYKMRTTLGTPVALEVLVQQDAISEAEATLKAKLALSTDQVVVKASAAISIAFARRLKESLAKTNKLSASARFVRMSLAGSLAGAAKQPAYAFMKKNCKLKKNTDVVVGIAGIIVTNLVKTEDVQDDSVVEQTLDATLDAEAATKGSLLGTAKADIKTSVKTAYSNKVRTWYTASTVQPAPVFYPLWVKREKWRPSDAE
jgi:hypothetical protein